MKIPYVNLNLQWKKEKRSLLKIIDNTLENDGWVGGKNIEKFEIQMFGINDKGETCSIYVENYRPFFFVRVGNNWTERTKKLFFEEIKKIIQEFRFESDFKSF